MELKPTAAIGWILLTVTLWAVYQYAAFQPAGVFAIFAGMVSVILGISWIADVMVAIFDRVVLAIYDARVLRFRAHDKDILLAFQLPNLNPEALRVLRLMAENEINLTAEGDLIVPGFENVGRRFLVLFYGLCMDKVELPPIREAYIWARGHRNARLQAEELTNYLIVGGYAAGSAGTVARWKNKNSAVESLRALGFAQDDIDTPSPTENYA